MTANDDHLVAIHEAAHACFAAMTGMDLKVAVVHRGVVGNGERGRVEVQDWLGELDADPTRYLVYLLIGGAAEQRAVGHRSERDGSDRENAATLCAATLDVEVTSPRVAARLNSAHALAEAAIQNEALWAWVQRTARAFVQRRRLSHRDIHELGPQARR